MSKDYAPSAPLLPPSDFPPSDQICQGTPIAIPVIPYTCKTEGCHNVPEQTCEHCHQQSCSRHRRFWAGQIVCVECQQLAKKTQQQQEKGLFSKLKWAVLG
eukprot:GEMP01080369.1.p3 GENE.GEMP01080369.1~~GEMP01080369.1.p3  ORF type:complete len:101 (+),score=21.02 GEMP01080369.1:76-378(+)